MNRIISFFLLCAAPACHLSAQTTIPYAGTFHNTLLNAGGTIAMTVTYWPGDSISGYVDFTEYPGNAPLCAAGNFTGQRVQDSLFHNFTSFDTDPGCGFDWGMMIYLFSELHNGPDSISGVYQADPTPGVKGAGYYNMVASMPTIVQDHWIGNSATAIFPNPTTGIAMLHLPEHVRLRELAVLDATGRIVSTRPVSNTFGSITLDLGGQPNGLYFVQVQLADGTRLTERLVKE